MTICPMSDDYFDKSFIAFSITEQRNAKKAEDQKNMEELDNEKFYIVWNPTGRCPFVKHETFDLAMQEANRISEKECCDVYVLEAKSCSSTKKHTVSTVFSSKTNQEPCVVCPP